MTLSAITLFCEDIRNETQGTEIIVGVLPDIVNVQNPSPINVPRLGVFTRANFPLDACPRELEFRVKVGGQPPMSSKVEDDVIDHARSVAEEKKLALVGFKSQAFLSFPLEKTIDLVATVVADGVETVTGAIRFEVVNVSADGVARGDEPDNRSF